MKFKDNNNYKNNELYLEMRNNNKAKSKIISSNRTLDFDEEKNTISASSILSLMVITKKYINAQNLSQEKTINDIIDKMYEISKEELKDKFENSTNHYYGELLRLENGNKYLVIDAFKYENREYIYLINNGNDFDVSIVCDNNNILTNIEEDESFEMFIQKIFIDLKEEIDNLL